MTFSGGKRHFLDSAWAVKLFARLTELLWSDVRETCASSRHFLLAQKKRKKITEFRDTAPLKSAKWKDQAVPEDRQSFKLESFLFIFYHIRFAPLDTRRSGGGDAACAGKTVCTSMMKSAGATSLRATSLAITVVKDHWRLSSLVTILQHVSFKEVVFIFVIRPYFQVEMIWVHSAQHMWMLTRRVDEYRRRFSGTVAPKHLYDAPTDWALSSPALVTLEWYSRVLWLSGCVSLILTSTWITDTN